jgi:serine/threonine protein kinase
MPVQAGQVIAERYRLVRPIGKGAQAAVWIAEHLALGSQVAVKLMDAELVEQADARERFRREATAAAQLRSAHVVHILDHGIENGQPFMVMEYLEGEDLFQRLERKGRLTLVEASVIVTQIARALARAHAAGIVHRDLKPENVYLVPNEDEEVAKVLDFGVAKFLEAGASQRRTSAGTLLGTPHYMSPEQVRGVGEIDHRSDLWSLGVIAYQLTVGDLPFESEGVGDLLIKITMERIPVPSKAHAPLPKTFDEWFAKACHRDPDKRFQTGRELAEALARVAGLVPASSDSLRGGVAPPKGRSEPPAFDVDFDEQPSIPPPPPPPPPDVAEAAAPAAPAAAKSEDVDDEWPDEPPSPSIPPPPVATAAAAVAAAGTGPPPRPLATAAKASPGAAPKPAVPAKLDMPTRGPRLPPPTAADLRVAPPSMPTQPDPVEVQATTKPEMPPPPPVEAPKAETPEAAPSASKAEASKLEEAAAAKPAPAVEPAPAKPAAAKPAAPVPAPRPSAARTSSPPTPSRSSDPPRSKNQLSSTISGAAGDVIPPPELDGSRKKRAVVWVAVLGLIGAAALAIAVVKSQGGGHTTPTNAGPGTQTAETRPTAAPPPVAPEATPSTSASTSTSATAVDPGTSKRPIKGGPSATPNAPPRAGGNRKPPPPKDGEIVIDVPLPDREVPVPPSP